jgi:hypothetical protein
MRRSNAPGRRRELDAPSVRFPRRWTSRPSSGSRGCCS